MWKYYLFKLGWLTLSRFPKRIGYFLVTVTADIIYLLSPGMRATVSENLRHVMGPDVNEAELNKTVRHVIENTAKNYFDLMKIPHLKLEQIERSVTIHGWEHIERARDTGKGMMLVTAHLGSFDYAAQMMAVRSMKATILVESLDPPSLFDHIAGLRQCNGLTVAPVRSGVSKLVLQALRQGDAVLMACDRDVQRDGIPHKFFGEETRMPLGAVPLAARAGAAILPVFSIRINGHYDIFIEPPITAADKGKEALEECTRQVVEAMEKYIRKYPEQWVVLHRVWGNGGTPVRPVETSQARPTS